MAASIQIREFCFPADYEPVYQLWKSIEKGIGLGRSDSLAEIEKKVSRDPDLFLVAVSERDIVGSVIGGFDGRRGLIYHLAVAASSRGQGIGSSLMEEVESRLRRKGCLKCYLLVTADNSEAEEFYRRRGWGHMDFVRLYGKELQ
ncbi:MAG TPA: GNAT family N-acetyltransferase [Anaerolineales bacterium]|nr:GNAT family N-acetyltransferase [Anaerolineales bacterium]